MRLIFLGILMWVGFTLRAQSFSTETIFTLHGASAIVTFNTPLLKSEKINFAQMGRFGIDYDGEHSMILLKSNNLSIT